MVDVGRAARLLRTARASSLSLDVGLEFRDDALALAAFHDLASIAPQRIKKLSSWDLLRVIAAARRTDPTDSAELRVHGRLVALKYEFPDGDPDDRRRVAHARALVRRGQLDRARRRLAPVVDPGEILAVRVSRVFDPLRGDPAFERHLDLRAAAEANLIRARAAAAARSRRLQPVRTLARALRLLGRAQEALTELDRAIALARAPHMIPRFDDVGEKLPWLLDAKASALYELGRTAEARAAFRAAITALPGQRNIHQAINFASRLEADGRPAVAIDLIRAAWPSITPYGRMMVSTLIACAAEQLGDANALDAAMTYLREHERDGVAFRAKALLCVNDIDGAAALHVRRLGDPVESDDALLAPPLDPFP